MAVFQMIRAIPIERHNAVAGLRELHREIAGELGATRQRLNRLAADLAAVEHTLRLLDPSAHVLAPSPPRRRMRP
jgi:hypothetical protein